MGKMRIYILIFAGLALLASCQPSVRFTSKAGYGKTNPNKNDNKPYLVIDESNLSSVQKSILHEAETWLGTPYCWGGEDRGCTDCSGFTKNIYQAIGVNLPRTAADQFSAGLLVDMDNIKTGDLIFFKKGDKITHVGIYIGNNQFIHA
ncbi:MAG: C40 family peptidase, partial [Bacteroidota bacterium]